MNATAHQASIFLIGYRGTGKSTVARLVAERLGWSWIDSDDEIERRAGMSIAEIFAQKGEPAFRDLETAVVADLAGRERTVIALGGGAVVREENRWALADRGPIVWLTASPETLWERISSDQATGQRRPNLTAQGGITEIIATLNARAPIYRQCADFDVDTTSRTPLEVAEAIIALVERAE